MAPSKCEEKTLEELLADVSIRVRLFRVALEKAEGKIKLDIFERRLTEHETLLISILGILGGDSEKLNIKDIHKICGAISLASLSMAITSLWADRYIEKRPPIGKKGYAICLTGKGFTKFNEIKANNLAAYRNVIEGFGLQTSEDEINMRKYLSNLVSYLDDHLKQLLPLLEKVDNRKMLE